MTIIVYVKSATWNIPYSFYDLYVERVDESNEIITRYERYNIRFGSSEMIDVVNSYNNTTIPDVFIRELRRGGGGGGRVTTRLLTINVFS